MPYGRTIQEVWYYTLCRAVITEYNGRYKLTKSTYDFELISYLFTYVKDVLIKTESVIHSYSKQFHLIFAPERKTHDLCFLSYYRGLVFGGIDQHTVASVPFVCNIGLMHEPPVN